MSRAVAALTLLLPFSALAGPCDSLVNKASSAKGEALVSTYASLLKCDQGVATDQFEAFMKSSGDVGTLVDLSLTAIRAKAYTPVWTMLEKIPDYSARNETAKGLGATCSREPEVETFLQGAYYGLRSRQFSQWEEALVECETDGMKEWMAKTVAEPPASAYDDKYNAVVGAFVDQMGPDALPVLERAAIAAANKSGPFSTVLEKMGESARPGGLAASLTDENRSKLEASMVKVAENVIPEQAALVADRLYNSGSESAAAGLLPRVYPERVQGNGNLLYGAAAIESCEGEAIIHYAAVIEPSKRWSILSDVESPGRAFKRKLKCDAEGPWPVLATSEPVEKRSDIDTWVGELEEQWSGKGLEVKKKGEKDIVLD